MKNLISAFTCLLLLVSPATATSLNMVEPSFDSDDNACFGVVLDSEYYGFEVVDGELKRINFQPCDHEEFVIEMSMDDLKNLVFGDLSFLEQTSYLVNTLNIPLEHVMDLTEWGII